MKNIFLILTLCIITLTGCAKEDNNSFEKYMEEGKVSIANKEYDKALNFFILAKEENENNEELNSLYNQTKNLVEAIESKEDKKYPVAIQICDTISKMDSDTDIIKQAAQTLKKECEKLINEQEQKENNKEEQENTSASQQIKTSHKQYFNSKLQQVENEAVMLQDSPDFDGGTTPELAMLASETYTLWDNLLNEIYGVLKTQLSEVEMSSLKSKQVNWLKYRDSEVDKVYKEYEGGTMAGFQGTFTKAELTRKRCYELVNSYIN